MPLGRQRMRVIACLAQSSTKLLHSSAPISSHDISIPGSLRRYSAFKAVALLATISCTALKSDVTSTASAFLGMALSAMPPLIPHNLASPFARTSSTRRAVKILAFPLCLSISTPECPPVKPETHILHNVPLSLRLCKDSEIFARTPPAQLTRRYPSSSESILIILRPSSTDMSIAAAPSMPTSSSTVKTHSSGG